MLHQVVCGDKVIASGKDKQAARSIVRTLNNLPEALADAMLEAIAKAAISRHELNGGTREPLQIHYPNERHSLASV